MPAHLVTGHDEAQALVAEVRCSALAHALRPALESLLRTDTRGAWLATTLSRPGELDAHLVESAYHRAEAELHALDHAHPAAEMALACTRQAWAGCIAAGALPWTEALRPRLLESWSAPLWTAALRHDRAHALTTLETVAQAADGVARFAAACRGLRRAEAVALRPALAERQELAPCQHALQWYLDRGQLAEATSSADNDRS